MLFWSALADVAWQAYPTESFVRDWVASAEIQMNDCANELAAKRQTDSIRDKC